MLSLEHISKDYGSAENIVHALKDVSLNFRNSEFVSILGPSGCGKTTLLNIIGGLDRYSQGNLIINGVATKDYQDRDWDNYRNKTIGFVFQSYNLIAHLSIEENVEMAMSLAGLSPSERKARAIKALEQVGLADKIKKKPSELSGGQMQRVAIARSLVNNPSVILADEPTGALDTETGLQVMETLKAVAQDRLVIMVTHNPQLADTYSTRIIKILNGEIVGDSHPLSPEEIQSLKSEDEKKLAEKAALPPQEKKRNERKSRMSFATSFSLSLRNLLTKKRRSFITSFACSIGIIGMAVILSVSSGMQGYVNQTMADSTYANYLTVSTDYIDYSGMMNLTGTTKTSAPEYPSGTTGITPYEASSLSSTKQDLNENYLAYVKKVTTGKIIAVDYTYGVEINALTLSTDGTYAQTNGSWDQILDNRDYIGTQYETLAGTGIPEKENEAALVVDKYNRLSTTTLQALNIPLDTSLSEIPYSSLLGREFHVIPNDDYYVKDSSSGSDLFHPISGQSQYENAYQSSNAIALKIISILRPLKSASTDWINEGLGYSKALSEKILALNQNSAVALTQYQNKTTDVTTGKAFSPSSGSIFGNSTRTYESRLSALGYTQTPKSITIYPTSFANKDAIKKDLDLWNVDHTDNIVHYTDTASYIMGALDSLITIITNVLVAFSAVSLIISSIMIALIIYASVIERTKEIGVLRALGARKKDVSRIFRSEAIILGGLSGVIALLFSLAIDGLINLVLNTLAGVSGIAALNLPIVLIMMLLAIALPLIASLIPASIAAKKDPVVALRSE